MMVLSKQKVTMILKLVHFVFYKPKIKKIARSSFLKLVIKNESLLEILVYGNGCSPEKLQNFISIVSL